MRLLKQNQAQIDQLDLDTQQLNNAELQQHIQRFNPEVIFALSDDENPYVLAFANQHYCHMGFFKPYKHQLDEAQLEQSRCLQLAKIIFLANNHPHQNYFEQCGKVIHQDYLTECHRLLNFLFFYDTSD